MTRISSRSTRRSAFTLVELLIVIAIIALLVSLSAAAIMRVMEWGPRVQTRTEIGQMEQGVTNVVQTYKLKFLPSKLKLSEVNNYPQASTPGTDDYNSVQFLKRMFPRMSFSIPHDWNRNNQADPDVILYGPECLVFFLGGAPGPLAQGFSANPQDPASLISIQPPAFEFQSSRLQPSPVAPGYNIYMDPYKTNKPYLYFSSYYNGNDYGVNDCAPYADVVAPPYGLAPYADPTSPTPRFINAQSFQIISAGKNGLYGPGGTIWDPAGGSQDLATKDNQANFARTMLETGQQ